MLKRWMIAALVLACASGVAEARERYFNYCQRGGQKVVTQGLQSSAYFQRTFQSCTIRVYLAGTTTLATIYSDNLTPASTPLANPFTAASDGFFFFYAAGGKYDVQETFTDTTVSPPVVIQLTWGDALLCDPIGPNADAACGSGSTAPHNLLSTTHPDTDPYTPPEIGDLIRGSLGQLWERFAKGSASQILAMNSAATLPTWQNFNFYQDSTTPVNSVGRLGVNLIEGTAVTISAADDAPNNRVNYTISASSGTFPDKFYMLLPDCPNEAFVGVEDITPIESYFSRTFDNFTIANVGESNCFVTYGSDTGVDQFAEIKEGSGFIRDQFPWRAKFYLRLNATTKERIWFGMTNSLATNWQTSDDPSLFAQDVVMVRFSPTGDAPDTGAGDTTYQLVTMFDGAAATITNTAVTPDTNVHKFEIAYNGSNAATLKIDDALITTVNGTFTDGLPLFWYVSVTSLDELEPRSFDYFGLQIIEDTLPTP